MAHITLKHPDVGTIRVPASQREYFLGIGWTEVKPESQQPAKTSAKTATKTAIKTPIKQPLNNQ